MKPLPPAQPEENTFVKRLVQALNQWRVYGKFDPVFAELRSLQRLSREQVGDSQRVVKRYLQQAIDSLHQHHPTESQFLKTFLLSDGPIDRLANQLHMGRATIYRHRDHGLPLLAAELERLEAKSIADYRRAIEDRLPAQRYHEQLGQPPEVQRVVDLLCNRTAPWLITITGIGGIGKTTLAGAVVRQVVDNPVWAEIGWVTAPRMTPSVGEIIANATVPALTVPALTDALAQQILDETIPNTRRTTPETVALLTSCMKKEAYLVVIDNLESEVDLQELLPVLRQLANPSKFLITSRASLFDAHDLHHQVVSELSETEALALLRLQATMHHIPQVLAATRDELHPIYATVGGNPLALKLVSGQLRIFTLTAVLEDLRKAQGRRIEDLYAHIYWRTWNLLGETAQSVLIALLLVSEQGGDFELLHAICELSTDTLHKALEILLSLHLVEVRGDLHKRLFAIHNLTRTFLQQQVIQKATVEAEALNKFQRHLECTLCYLVQSIEQVKTIPSEEVRRQALHTLSYALSEPAVWQSTRLFLLTLAPKMEQAGHRHDWLPYLEQATRLSENVADTPISAELHLQRGMLHRLLSEFEVAKTHLQRSIDLYRQLGDNYNQARALNELAWIETLQNQTASASEHVTQALALLAVDDPERAMCYRVQGMLAIAHERWIEAETLHRQALAIFEQEGDARKAAWSLQNLAYALRGQERFDEAIAYYEQAAELLQQMGDLYHWSVVQMNLGLAYAHSGRHENALNYYTAAQSIPHSLLDRFHLARLHVNSALSSIQLSQYSKAESSFLDAIQLLTAGGAIAWRLNAMDGLAMTYIKWNKFNQAISVLEQALKELPMITNAPNYTYLYSSLHQHLEEAQNSRHIPL